MLANSIGLLHTPQPLGFVYINSERKKDCITNSTTTILHYLTAHKLSLWCTAHPWRVQKCIQEYKGTQLSADIRFQPMMTFYVCMGDETVVRV